MSMNTTPRSGRTKPLAARLWDRMYNGRNDGPPDLDELWRDFNRKLSNMFGGKGGDKGSADGGNGGGNGGNNNFQPDMKSAGVGVAVVGGIVLLGWLGSGLFTVQEGQQAVITSFGKYSSTVGAGIQYRLPYPFQNDEIVSVTQLKQVDIGRASIIQATGLRDSSMLTEDENIVDIRFTVQYTLKDARDYLFENFNPDDAVTVAAESAVREIVGKNTMDAVLYEQRDAIANELIVSIQTQLDRLKAGIVVKNVNMQSVQAPEQVQAAFDDAFKAKADRETYKNDAQAYANNVIPDAQGKAAQFREQAEGYKASVVSQAEGDAQRFKSVLAEYQRAPQVTRDRLYIDTMQQVYANVTKVMVDSQKSSPLLYLPLDKLMHPSGAGSSSAASSSVTATVPTPAPMADNNPAQLGSSDMRSRDGLRSRDRDSH